MLKAVIFDIADKRPPEVCELAEALYKAGLKIKFISSLPYMKTKNSEQVPNIFKNSLSELDISTNEAVVIVDSNYGIEMTRAAWIAYVRYIKELYLLYIDPYIRRYIENIDDDIEIEMEKQKAYVNTVYSFFGYGLWGVFDRTDGKLVGRCGIENHKRKTGQV